MRLEHGAHCLLASEKGGAHCQLPPTHQARAQLTTCGHPDGALQCGHLLLEMPRTWMQLGAPGNRVHLRGRRLARLRHAETHHPDEPKDLFLLKVGTATGARKATVAKLSAGVAKRVQRLKAGEAGDHDVVCVKLPPPPNSAVSKAGKRRRALSKLICKRCKRISADCKDMAVHPCKLVV